MTRITPTPYKIGITGTVASGKTAVGRVLEAAGVPVLDTDTVVARLYEDDPELIQQLAHTFGSAVLNASGHVDKNALRQAAFYDPEKRRQLETLVHPRVGDRVKAFLTDTKLAGKIRAILVPLLFEANTEALYDEVWAVTIKPEVLLERLMTRDGITKDEAQRRISSQWSQDQKAAKADRVIDNSGSLEATRQQVLAALDQIRDTAGV